jgi:hypothetical protein
MKFPPLLLYPYHYNLAEVTASLCITAAHCRQFTNFSNGPRLIFYVVLKRRKDG